MPPTSGERPAAPTSDDPRDLMSSIDEWRAFGEQCLTNTGEELAFFDTLSAAKDMERIRIALGAQPKHVLRLIMGYGMKLTILGVSIGLVAAWAATRLLASLLFGLSATDTTTFSAICVLLGVV